jgi:hypothetical protein
MMVIRRHPAMMPPESAMRHPRRATTWLVAWVLVGALCPTGSYAKGYSSGGHSYSSSSHSSFSSGGHSFSSGGGHSFGSGGSRSFGSGAGAGFGSRGSPSAGGKSYASGSAWRGDNRHGYGSGKSYASGLGPLFGSGPALSGPRPASPRRDGFSFDVAAGRALKEQGSRHAFQQYKDARAATGPFGGSSGAPSYQGKPPPLLARNGNSWRPPGYVPDTDILVSRPDRARVIFGPYYSRPTVTYQDPYNNFFWWWLLDRSLEDRAWWAYHHRYDMDAARYQALLASDQQLQARVAQLEAQQPARDPNYVPPGMDRDLMYSDRYVANAYNNRPTFLGVAAFFILGVPAALALCGFVIWLIWFKRWPTAT